MKHIEYEERMLITENDYKKVIDVLTNAGYKIEPFTIENIYFDNKDFYIDKNGMMLRIRNTSPLWRCAHRPLPQCPEG